jgi:hypothetical protein
MRLFALCIVISSLATHVVGQNGKPQPPSHTAHSQDATAPRNPPPQIIIEAQSNQQAADKDDAAKQTVLQRFLSNPEWVSAFGTLMIFVATAVYVIISSCMLKKVGEQVVIAGDAAKEAKASTDALIDIERPWVRVLIPIDAIEVPPLPHSPSRPFVYIWPQIDSVGRTPARTKCAVFKKHLIPKDDNLPPNVPPQLPDKPDYSGGVSVVKQCLVVPDTGIRPMPVDVAVEDWSAIKKRDLFLYVYGFVEYHGVGATDRSTGFCNIYWIPYGKSDPQPEGFLTSANTPDRYIWSF